MSTVTASTPMQEPAWLSFRIGVRMYAAPLHEVSTVVRDGEVTPVPGAAADLRGIRHHRGQIVPVLDGRLRLGLEDPPASDPTQARIVVLACNGHLVGLGVDAVGDLLGPSDLDGAPDPDAHPLRNGDPVDRVMNYRDGFVALLDVGRLCRLTPETDHVA